MPWAPRTYIHTHSSFPDDDGEAASRKLHYFPPPVYVGDHGFYGTGVKRRRRKGKKGSWRILGTGGGAR